MDAQLELRHLPRVALVADGFGIFGVIDEQPIAPAVAHVRIPGAVTAFTADGRVRPPDALPIYVSVPT
jgi:hypothetical protein